MLGFGRRRSEQPRRPQASRRAPERLVEGLESRQLLTTSSGALYHAQVLTQNTRATTSPAVHYSSNDSGLTARQLSQLDNDGKIVTGRDRDGDEWQITVHGPGSVIVTDATPLDGALDDDIVTIQLVDTSLQ
jgi:hypothetical protein